MSAVIKFPDNDNLQMQADEIETLTAIYGDELITLEPENHVYVIRVNPPAGDSRLDAIALKITFPPYYPKNDTVVYEVQAPWLRGPELAKLQTQLDQVAKEGDGLPVAHDLVETARSFLEIFFFERNRASTTEEKASEQGSSLPRSMIIQNNVPSVRTHLEALPNYLLKEKPTVSVLIEHGQPLVDRKSVFQAHLGIVHSTAEVSAFLTELLHDRKVVAATHNILAWRVGIHGDLISADCDDDGETHAGSRLLHMLTISGALNAVVVVSRWYGGIQLGPDRFRHIIKVARDLLVEKGLLRTLTKPARASKKKK